AFQEATMTFADPSKQWLSGISDADGESVFNWIRSGTSTFEGSTVYNDFIGIDNIQSYEKVLGGTWAPYRLCGSTPTTVPNPIVYSAGPAWGAFATLNQIKNTASVDVIITSDQSKWTRCPVLELQEETALAIGGTKKLHMRSSLSVDKNGLNSTQSGYNASEGDLNGITGMGWFPGYALNLETGERLNMAFGEDSWLASENGADMKWNPSSNIMSQLSDAVLFGGKHYVYVFGHNGDARYSGDAQMGNGLSDVPRYDGGKTVHDLLAAAAATATSVSDGYKRNVFADAMWVNMAVLTEGHTVLETDVKIRLRVTKAYSKYGTGDQVPSGSLVVGQNYFVESGPITHNAISRLTGTSFVAADASWTSTNTSASVLSTVNKADPIYEFNTNDIGTRKEDAVAAEDALSLINIVPNPYYAYSGYEQKTSDNVVKITNLPRNCTVSIYTLNGTLIRTITKSDDDIKASLDWDMKNQARIPIASGMYIIHVDVPNVGEKILKWFGVMRPLDLEAY
ncbi:MAG: T9SS type A sorting domain-containing protein, partial [Bacteroidetes bacterium]|nr:T9SS type A sorting domain-containing protein [Bacteroidota bacterium]